MAQTLEERLKSRLSSAVKSVAGEMSSQAVSGFLVKRLLVKGSFKNVFNDDGKAEGFQLLIRNRLAVTTIIGISPVKIDGEFFGIEQIAIKKGTQILKASRISESVPLNSGFGDEFTIIIADDQGLEAGTHTIELGLKIVGAGLIEAKFEDELSGKATDKRIRKVETLPQSKPVDAKPAPAKADKQAPTAAASGDFADVMRRMIEMAVEKIGRETLVENAKIVSGIVLHMKDTGEKYGVKISPDGSAGFVQGAIEGDSVLTITITRSDFHNLAYGSMNPGLAFARGAIKLEGVPLLKLRGMDTVITAIFRGYRAASSGLKFDQAEEVAGSGMFEEILGMALERFDKLLKVADKALGIVGVKYFYEKSMNRFEHTWDIFDRQIRKMLSFGREKEVKAEHNTVKTAKADAPEPAPAEPSVGKSSSTGPEFPRAPSKSLQDRLKARLSTAVSSAVSGTVTGISRTAISGYLVKKLIMPGSFKNYESDGGKQGFEVKLKNKLGVSTILGFERIQLDGESFGADRIEIIKAGKSIIASEVSEKSPLQVSFGDELLIRVKIPGGIKPGKHKVSLGVSIVGLGIIDVAYEEELAA